LGVGRPWNKKKERKGNPICGTEGFAEGERGGAAPSKWGGENQAAWQKAKGPLKRGWRNNKKGKKKKEKKKKKVEFKTRKRNNHLWGEQGNCLNKCQPHTKEKENNSQTTRQKRGTKKRRKGGQ